MVNSCWIKSTHSLKGRSTKKNSVKQEAGSKKAGTLPPLSPEKSLFYRCKKRSGGGWAACQSSDPCCECQCRDFRRLGCPHVPSPTANGWGADCLPSGVTCILHPNLEVSVVGPFWAHSLTVFLSADMWVALTAQSLFVFGHFHC